MICGHEWLPSGLALSLSTLACLRTPMDEQQAGTMNTTGGSGGVGTTATSGGNAATIGNTGQGGITGATGGSTGIVGGIPSYAGTTSSTRSTGGITGVGGNRCATIYQDTCATDDDCTVSNYRPPIASAADCYCFLCDYPVASAIVGDCQIAYNQLCGPNWQTEHNRGVTDCYNYRLGCAAGVCQMVYY
jgi:hypothetical protein